MKNLTEITNNLKNALKISSDKDLAELLNMKATAFSERKRTNSIPHNEILELCITENLNINTIYTDKTEEINYKEELLKTIEELKPKQIEYLYHVAKSAKLTI